MFSGFQGPFFSVYLLSCLLFSFCVCFRAGELHPSSHFLKSYCGKNKNCWTSGSSKARKGEPLKDPRRQGRLASGRGKRRGNFVPNFILCKRSRFCELPAIRREALPNDMFFKGDVFCITEVGTDPKIPTTLTIKWYRKVSCWGGI